MMVRVGCLPGQRQVPSFANREKSLGIPKAAESEERSLSDFTGRKQTDLSAVAAGIRADESAAAKTGN